MTATPFEQQMIDSRAYIENEIMKEPVTTLDLKSGKRKYLIEMLELRKLCEEVINQIEERKIKETK